VTGITPALSSGAAETTREALDAARATGLRTSIDLNYRAKLWSTADARRCMTDLLPLCNVVITTEEDAERVLGIGGDNPEAIAAQIARRFSVLIVAITLRDNPLVWSNAWTAIAYEDGKLLGTRTYELEIVDRLGAGDCFAAGLIHGLLDNDLQKSLNYRVAAR